MGHDCLIAMETYLKFFNPLLPSVNKYKDGEAPSRPHHVPKAARSGWVECICITDSGENIVFFYFSRSLNG